MYFNCEQFSKSKILTVQDVTDFTVYLVHNVKVNIHPDTPFEDYVNLDNGNPTFSKDDIIIGNKLMKQCFDVCAKNDIDIYELMNDISERY